MTPKLFSRPFLAKTFVSALIAVSGVSVGTVGTVAMAQTQVNLSTTAEDAALQNLINQITSVHNALTSTQLAQVKAVVTNAQNANWNSIVYGTQTPNAAVVNAIKSLLMLPYSGATDPTTVKSTVLTNVDAVDPSITGTDLYNFYTSFKQEVESEVLSSADSKSLTDIVTSAITTAVQNNSKFSGVLTNHGLHVSDLPGIWNNATQQISGLSDATNTLAGVYADMKLNFTPSTATVYVTQGTTVQFTAALKEAVSLLPAGTQVQTLLHWTADTGTIDSNAKYTASVAGTATVTASIHGITVHTFTLNVSPAGVVVVPPSGPTTPPVTPPVPPAPPQAGSGFSQVVKQVTVSTDGGTIQTTAGKSEVTVVIPGGTFSKDEQIVLTSGDPTTVSQSIVPAGYKPQVTIGINFTGATPNQPITLKVSNPAIPAGAKVFKVTDDGKLVPVQATVSNGEAVITFQSDPNFIIVVPDSHKGIYFNGKAMASVPSVVKDGTTYMPIWYVMHALSQNGFTSKWDGHHWYLTTRAGATVNFSNVNVGTGSMYMYLNGKLVQKVNGIYDVDPSTGNNTTYMPIWYVMQTLKRAGVQNTWDGTSWNLSWTKPATTGTTAHATLKIGSHGQDVILLQQKLGITADGVFGQQTAAAVKHFQSTHGLVADGIVGAKTWAVLLK